MNRTQQSVSYKAWKLGLTRGMSKGRTGINPFYFDTWSPNMAYIIGIIAADGNLFKVKNKESYRITITQYDKHLLEWIAKEIGYTGKIKESIIPNTVASVGTHVQSKKSEFYRYDLVFCSKYIYDRLEEIGISQNKSLTLGKLQIPREYFKYFLRGYIDGDGSVSYYKDKRKVKDYYSLEVSILGSYNFLKWIQAVVHTVTNLPKQKPYTKIGSKIKVIRYRGNVAVSFCKWLYSDELTFGIQRKVDTFKEFQKLDGIRGFHDHTP